MRVDIRRLSLTSAVSVVLAVCVISATAKDAKLKPEDVVQRHLASVGSSAKSWLAGNPARRKV